DGVALDGLFHIFAHQRADHVRVVAVHQQLNAFAKKFITAFAAFQRQQPTFTRHAGHAHHFVDDLFRLAELEGESFGGHFYGTQKLPQFELHHHGKHTADNHNKNGRYVDEHADVAAQDHGHDHNGEGAYYPDKRCEIHGCSLIKR